MIKNENDIRVKKEKINRMEEPDDYNIQVVLEKTEEDCWKVNEFVVIYQPEPWSPETFVAIMDHCRHLHDPPLTEFTWSQKQIIKVKVIVQ